MAEKPVSIPGTIKWQRGRIVGGFNGGAAYLYAINRYGTECCLGKWESENPDDAEWLRVEHTEDVTLLDALDELTAYHRDEPLRLLIAAELSGARRARERAERFASSDAIPPHAREVAANILEAFDGE